MEGEFYVWVILHCKQMVLAEKVVWVWFDHAFIIYRGAVLVFVALVMHSYECVCMCRHVFHDTVAVVLTRVQHAVLMLVYGGNVRMCSIILSPLRRKTLTKH